jgi:hypothetical protein
MLVGCTYPGRGITTPQACRGDDIVWDAGASYYDLSADGRVTVVWRSWLPSLAALGAGGQLNPTISTGTWTESPGAVTVTWDGDVSGLFRKTVERIDADTLRDTYFAGPGILFWFVKPH